MNEPCSACSGTELKHLTVRYSFPRPAFLAEAADPWNVHGSEPLVTCGSPGCEANALLALVDGIITDSAVNFGHLLSPGDIRITGIGHPGDFTDAIISDEDAA